MLTQHLVTPGLWVERRSNIEFAKNAGLFLDRDGVINVNYGYVGDPSDVVLISTIGEVIALANKAEIPVIVVTNQSGVGRGYYSWAGFSRTMDKIHELLKSFDARIDMICACAYHENAKPEYSAIDHPMRKPNPGMIKLACKELCLSASESFLVGDSISDIEAGLAAGINQGIYLGNEENPDLHHQSYEQFNIDTGSNLVIAKIRDFLNLKQGL